MCITIFIGFSIYFLVDFMYVLGSRKIKSFYCRYCPTAICFFIGCYLVSVFDEIKNNIYIILNLKIFLIFIFGINNKVFSSEKNYVIATINRSPITYFDLNKKQS